MDEELNRIEQELQIFTESNNFVKNNQVMKKLSQLENTIDTLRSQLSQTTVEDYHDLKFQIKGKVTKLVVDNYYKCQSKFLLAPSPLELLHNQLCDYHVIQQNSKIYKQTEHSEMLRSKSVGKSQLSGGQISANTMFPVIAQIGDIITAYGSMTGFKPILPKGQQVSFQQIYDLVLKITPKHCMGVTLDQQQCLHLLEDGCIIPSIIQPLKLQVLFQRAVYLQTTLFMQITANNTNTLLSKVYVERLKQKPPQFSTFNYNTVKKLSYIGFIYLIYAIAEELEKRVQVSINYKPQQLADPYDVYKYSTDCDDYNKLLAFTGSWRLIHQFGSLLDEFICTNPPNCQQYGLLVVKPKLMPDLHKYPNCILVFSKYVGLIKKAFGQIPTESQLMDYNYLYKICALAGIHQQLSRDFCYELVLRLFSKVDKASFIPGLDEDEFLIAIFVCANYALYKEPFVQRFKKPEERLQYVLEQLNLRI